MFGVELRFDDGISPDEMIIVRRNSFVVGASDDADVMIEGAANPGQSIQIRRSVGRRFVLETFSAPEKTFEGTGQFQLGSIHLTVFPLDIDLMLQPSESMDKGGMRVLNRALSQNFSDMPAIEVRGGDSFSVSFAKDLPLYFGRSRSCGVRLDNQKILAEHAVVGASPDYWIEPASPEAAIFLRSGARVEKRLKIDPEEVIKLGDGTIEIQFLHEQSKYASERESSSQLRITPAIQRFPCLVSRSELMRPERYPLLPGRKVSIGRDPANDIWLNVSHVSRLHAEIFCDEDGTLQITDYSSNGTFIDDVQLEREVPRELGNEFIVLDFSKGMTVAVCFNAQEEEEFLGKERRPPTASFIHPSSLHGQILSQISIPVTPFNSDEDQEPDGGKFSLNEAEPEQPRFASDLLAASPRTLMSGRSYNMSNNLTSAGDSPTNVVKARERLDDFSPESRLGLSGKRGQVFFWVAIVFLVVVNYFVWVGK